MYGWAKHLEAPIALVDEELTHTVIGGFWAVFNKLGHGFLENVYVGALYHELRKRGLHVEREVPVAVYYDGIIVGTFRVDLLVEHRLVHRAPPWVGAGC